MNQIVRPDKEEVRAWLKREIDARQPPPDIEQIRRELGWGLVRHADEANSGSLILRSGQRSD